MEKAFKVIEETYEHASRMAKSMGLTEFKVTTLTEHEEIKSQVRVNIDGGGRTVRLEDFNLFDGIKTIDVFLEMPLDLHGVTILNNKGIEYTIPGSGECVTINIDTLNNI